MIIADKAVADKKEKSQVVTYAIMITIGVHFVIALYLLVSHIADIKKQKETELVAKVLGPPVPQPATVQKQEIKKQTTHIGTKSGAAMSRVLTSNATANTAIPMMTNVTDVPIGLGEGNLGVGFGQRVSADLGKGAVFFGQKVTGQMGVVFDVSASMQEYIPIVVREIQRNFRSATVVCVNSSALISCSRPPRVVAYKTATMEDVNLPYLDNDVGQAMNRDLGALPNCWYIRKDYTTLGEAMEYLLNEHIPTIFVFSDFRDTFVGSYAESLTIKAQAEKAQINLHVLNTLESGLSSREPFLKNMCATTKGRYAVGELLKRAGQ